MESLSNFEGSSESGTGLDTPLHNVSSQDCGLTRQERLKMCCKPTYRMRRLKNKGVIMILIWNFLITTMFFANDSRSVTTGNYRLQFILQLIAGGLTLPIAGWLADVYFGRYKVIRFSMWLMWIAYMLVTVNAVVTKLIVSESYSNISTYMNNILLIVVTMGFGTFIANIINFGLDQLHDASTNEITSFIIWYVWTDYVSGFVAQLVFDCVPKEYETLKMLAMCAYLSTALCSLLLFNHLLVKEPVTQNPFKLVYNVISYAIKTKHPRYRSAFTYCEDELPSRIDFGKSKYGGPFTTEQVEDVKTFLRFVALIMVGSILFGAVFATDSLMFKLSSMLTAAEENIPYSASLYRCYSKNAFVYICLYFWAIILPVYEVIIYPVFQRILVVVKSQMIFMLGTLFLMVTVSLVMLIEAMTRYHYLEIHVNSTIQCVEPGILSTSMNDHWMALPYVFRSLSVALFSVGTFQFIASQVPYSMRGLVMGTAFGLLSLSATGVMAINLPFTRNLSIWGTRIISCAFWSGLTLLAIIGTAGITLYLILKKYKRRKREDVLPNEHIFAERYYEVKS